jgi:hypothetical protein
MVCDDEYDDLRHDVIEVRSEAHARAQVDDRLTERGYSREHVEKTQRPSIAVDDPGSARAAGECGNEFTLRVGQLILGGPL